ncbi:hypothetical protein EW146_g8049 [Bondarzewia mesenterica]|uniref:Uncharacterized protein n=1 Tax=Bondarzewia mesenterica TaxID=1095465 RepID=A0A4S4LI45_9AGAM|nr:hypothetical protein EW146_g8049 [Bondarzewia mesenterica]
MQFQNVAQYDEHTISYAHHHKVWFRDMQMAQRQKQNTEEELSKRKEKERKREEKERKREEKELRKIAAAAGIKIAKPATPIGSMPALAGISAGSTAKAPEPKKGGWTTVSTASADAFAAAQSASPSASAFRRASNWASVDSSPPPPPISAGDRVPAVSHANSHPLSPVPSMPPQPLTPARPLHTHHPAPSFRTAGWSSLDTSSSMPPPPQPPTIHVPTFSMGGWAPLPPQEPYLPIHSESHFHPVGAQRASDIGPPLPAFAPPPRHTPTGPSVPAPLVQSSSSTKAGKQDAREKGRSGWQAFQKGGWRK